MYFLSDHRVGAVVAGKILKVMIRSIDDIAIAFWTVTAIPYGSRSFRAIGERFT